MYKEKILEGCSVEVFKVNLQILEMENIHVFDIDSLSNKRIANGIKSIGIPLFYLDHNLTSHAFWAAFQTESEYGEQVHPMIVLSRDALSVDEDILLTIIAHELGHHMDFTELFDSNYDRFLANYKEQPVYYEESAWVNAKYILEESTFNNWDTFYDKALHFLNSYYDNFNIPNCEREVFTEHLVNGVLV
ncbi:hypothetical protein KLEB273_gp275 [Bacillus phage vB_BauM_KLEB27-3]|nr:hypothetical protein KLEB273_gp275 [Bacillus phage vB_BauM_KLEB27-3]